MAHRHSVWKTKEVLDIMKKWDYEMAKMKVVATGRFHKYSEEMAKYIVPGSQHWQILRIAG